MLRSQTIRSEFDYLQTKESKWEKKIERESQFYDSPPRNNAPIRGKGRA